MDDATWNRRCRALVRSFREAGKSARWHLRMRRAADMDSYARSLARDLAGVPGREVAVVVMDAVVYEYLRGPVAALRGDLANATLVVYETSVVALEDIRGGAQVLALDFDYYTQGYLAVALVSAERQTGQMVTSDIETEFTIYGDGATPVTGDVLQREWCRFEGYPVCGDLGDQPKGENAPKSLCPCFNRSGVRHKVVGGIPLADAVTHHLWQGLRDAQMDIPGSTFFWQVPFFVDYGSLTKEYHEVANMDFWYGSISFDAILAETRPELAAAMRGVSLAGKPLYLAYLQGSPPTMPASAGGDKDNNNTDINGSGGSGGVNGASPGSIQPLLDAYGARAFVGASPYLSGAHLGHLARMRGLAHTLANNALVGTRWAWEVIRGLVTGVVGEGYALEGGIWDWPLTEQGNDVERTGAWQLFKAPGSNDTVQAMNGNPPGEGDLFLRALRDRLASDLPAPDVAAILALENLWVARTLEELVALNSRQAPGRPHVQLATHRCLRDALVALLGKGYLEGDELLAGCVDEQPYLAAYLAATLAALEQHTGERVVGAVHTQRLLMQGENLPPSLATRAGCEAQAHSKRINEGLLATLYPLCNARMGCVNPATALLVNATVCSGKGTCVLPNVTYNGTGGAGTGGVDISIEGGDNVVIGIDPGPFPWLNNISREEAEILQGACVCFDGYEGAFCQSSKSGDVAPATEDERGLQVALVAVLSTTLGVMLVAGVPLVLLLRRRAAKNAYAAYLRKRGPPHKGEPITAVITDIEGSTSLWEWDPVVMKKALAIHHNVLRTLLPKYHGYESDTEGDSFTMVFYEPDDALGWAMDVQRSLLFPLKVFNLPTTPTKGKHKGLLPSIEDGHTDWPPELLTFGTGMEIQDPTDGSLLYRGLRVRMGIHVGLPDGCSVHPNGRHHYHGEVMEMTKAIEDVATSGGQVLMSMLAWQSLAAHQPSVVCHHMGLHEVGEKLPPIHLMQVLPEELLKRAPFAPLKSKQLRPSFFDAPAADCYVKRVMPTEPMVIAFMYVGGAKVLRRSPTYGQAVAMVVEFVQGVMSRYDAYEVEEKDGNFLLAFWSPVQAVRFAEAVQREAMALDWPKKLLEQELAAEVVTHGEDADGSTKTEIVVFRGLRYQIGLCMGVPSDCHAHRATGRAAYCGPVVNRAARIAATAAHGQTLANDVLFEAAKGDAVELTFTELGQFDLKGVKQPMHLYQVSSAELSVRLFPRTLKLAKVTEPIVEFEVTTPRAQDAEDSVADGLRLPPHLVLSISLNAKTTRKSISMHVNAGGGLQTLGVTRNGESLARRDNRISRLLSGLSTSPPMSDAPSAPHLPTKSGANQGHRRRGRPSDEAKSHGRRSEESTATCVSIDEALYDEMSYDELLKLAMKQHEQIKALKKLPTNVPEK
eukprot:jgi/Mesvir1/22911/Mv19429-RA.2